MRREKEGGEVEFFQAEPEVPGVFWRDSSEFADSPEEDRFSDNKADGDALNSLWPYFIVLPNHVKFVP